MAEGEGKTRTLSQPFKCTGKQTPKANQRGVAPPPPTTLSGPLTSNRQLSPLKAPTRETREAEEYAATWVTSEAIVLHETSQLQRLDDSTSTRYFVKTTGRKWDGGCRGGGRGDWELTVY